MGRLCEFAVSWESEGPLALARYDVQKVRSRPGEVRLRIGAFRILFEVDGDHLRIMAVGTKRHLNAVRIRH